MAHLICVGTTRRGVEETLGRLSAGGVENVLALRGDLPAGEDATASSNDLKHSTDLLQIVAGRDGFCAGGACYPEIHPESANLDEDLGHALLKVANGATFLITQLFLENAAYFRFVERASARGLERSDSARNHADHAFRAAGSDQNDGRKRSTQARSDDVAIP